MVKYSNNKTTLYKIHTVCICIVKSITQIEHRAENCEMYSKGYDNQLNG